VGGTGEGLAGHGERLAGDGLPAGREDKGEAVGGGGQVASGGVL